MKPEVKSTEMKEIKNPSLENYRNIKPEKPMSTSEANNFWKSEFQKAADEAKNETPESKQPKQHLDDNGKLYREGDHLLPNTSFEMNGYNYKTDDMGRVISAEGKLRLSDDPRNMERVRNKEGQEYRAQDEQGHLIAHRFGGSDRLENLVPMDSLLNNKGYKKLENKLADALKDNADVRLKVEPVYEKDSTRPSEFKVSYSIDGDRETTVFRNEREE